MNRDGLEVGMQTALAIHWGVEQLSDPHTCICGGFHKNHKDLRAHLHKFDGASCLTDMTEGFLLWYDEEMADRCDPDALEALRVEL